MENNYSIEVNNISKSFKVFLDKGHTLKEMTIFKKRRNYEVRQAIKDISFKVKKGEALALIGENGCGKSTTLKLLTKIMYPDTGNIIMNGRVSSLIELGAGFHPDMSGRENIYINASIFGLSKSEIDARLDDIIAFSELEEFIDNPVRTYSSGMYMRLAFSVAINVDADILLIDEILAVGDENFQTKCFNKLREIKATGVTIVLVTHSMGTVESFCDQAIWIKDGLIEASGNSIEVVDKYLEYMNQRRIETALAEEERQERKETTGQSEQETIPEDSLIEKIAEINEKQQVQEEETQEEPIEEVIEEETYEDENGFADSAEHINYEKNHFGLGHVVITKAQIINSEGRKTKIIESGEKVKIEIHYEIKKPLDEYVFGIGIYTMDYECLMGSNTQLDRFKIDDIKDTGCVTCEVEINLLKGLYILNVAVVDKDGTPSDFYRDYLHFEVISKDRSVGTVYLKRNWEIK